MEKTAKQKNNPYLIGFIKWKGSAKRLQHTTELNYQSLTQLEKGTRFGSAETFRKLLDAYPGEFDVTKAASGEPFNINEVGKPSLNTTDDGIDWKARCIELEEKYDSALTEIKTWASKYEALVDKYEKVVDKLMRKLDPSFSESDSQFTAIPMTRRLISMGRHDSDVAECIVMTHPATAELASVRVLDSRVVRIGA